MGTHAEQRGEVDVIIVGGRPAGASLAARLGQKGVRTLVLDRSEFPSPPPVPSAPMLFPPALRLLDEIGVEEASYSDDSARVRRFVVEFDGQFRTVMAFPEVFGRDYFLGVERSSFDVALWSNLDRFPSVTARQRFAVTDLVRDDRGRVTGVKGRTAEGAEETLFARCVVGADGRHSLVARKAGATVVEDCSERLSTVYFAYWDSVKLNLPSDERGVHICTNGRGTNVILLPAPRGQAAVSTYMRANLVDIRGDVEAFYHETIRSFGPVRGLLDGARIASPIVGIKRIANRYLEHGGPGWVLVGDALHHKDPVDGQGIYDALVESKLLAEELIAVLDGRQSWDDMLASYWRRVHAETHPMFVASMKRIEQELYSEPPAIAVRTLLRWLLSSPEYHRRFLMFLGRALHPDEWLSPSLVVRAALEGMIGDLRRLAGRTPMPETRLAR